VYNSKQYFIQHIEKEYRFYYYIFKATFLNVSNLLTSPVLVLSELPMHEHHASQEFSFLNSQEFSFLNSQEFSFLNSQEFSFLNSLITVNIIQTMFIYLSK